MKLSGLWRMQSTEPGQVRPQEWASPGFDDRFWMTAKVPGDVHTALIERQMIDHPYYGHNDLKCRWIEDKEWWYRYSFHYDEEPQTASGYIQELDFGGLDTFATVFLNGLELGTTSNMLMGHTFDVTRILRKGWNCIAVRFDPISKHNKDKHQFQWSSYTKERPWLRKAAMNFGWDWGPRMVTVGIWGEVSLTSRRLAKLDSVYVQTLSITEQEAVLQLDIEAIPLTRQQSRSMSCYIYVRDQEGKLAAEATFPIERAVSETLTITDPKLWWTHDLGEPYLHELEVILKVDNEAVDTYTQALGIRTIELQLQDPENNNSFVFLLNGVSIFAKGANWIPVDHFIGSAPDSRYKELIVLAKDANMNMLRVWGGGIYEKDIFYEECNRLGILVWQDFAFANALFPDYNKDFMNNVREEVRDNVKRLRNHPSLALWCGNNEIDWLYDMKSSSGDITTPFYGERIYHELIPDSLAELDPGRPYWPSSPYGGNDANDPDEGDRHNWQVWHGSVYPRKFGEVPLLDYSVEGVTFKNFKKDMALFSSEFGMHASANRYTLEKNIPEGQFTWGSIEMAYRNKDTNHQKGILLMEGYTGIPTTIEEYMNFSMLTQAEGLKYGIEHYRRNKHRTSGALIWQLNDSWPGTSWSLIDYELLPKASYYYARSFFDPVLVSLSHEPGQPLQLWLVNDSMQAVKGSIELKVLHFDGTVICSHSYSVEGTAGAAAVIGQLEEVEALQGYAAEEVIVELTSKGFQAPVNRYYLRDHKELRLPDCTLTAELNEAEQTVSITAGNSLARMVKLELPMGRITYSDNYFDLLPGETRTIQLRHPEYERISLSELKVSAINCRDAELLNLI